MSDLNSQLLGWPKFADYPQTESGWNEYANAWVSRRRRAPMLNSVPSAAVAEYQSAMAMGRERGWEGCEEG